MKRVKEKKKQEQREPVEGGDNRGDEKNDADQQDADQDIKLVDQFTPYLVIRSSGKIRSFDFGPDGGVKGGIQVQTHAFFCIS